MAISKIENSSLASGVPSRSQLPAGTVLQVVQGTKLDTDSTTSTSYVDVNGLTATITPSSASNKILVLLHTGSLANNSNTVQVNIVRNGTNIAQPASGTNSSTINHFPGGNQNAGGDGAIWLDSPATTSAITYKVQWCVDAGTGYFNRHVSGTNYNSVATITLMEIAA